MTFENLYKYILQIFIFVLIFSGFITNFLLYQSSINTGTMLIDLLYLILLSLYILYNIKFKNYNIKRQALCIIVAYIIIIILALIKMSIDSNDLVERISGLRNYFIYILIFMFASNLKRTQYYIELIEKIINFSCILFVFSIFQFVLKDHLPDKLMRLKGEGIYTYATIDILRANGLLGHPVIFGGFCVIIFTLLINMYIYYKNKKYLIFLIICSLATFASSSRLAIIGIVTSLLLTLILDNRINKLKKVLKICFFVFIFIGVLYVIYSLYPNLYIFNIFLAKDQYVQGSNTVHLQQVNSAIEYIRKNILFGVGMGSQGISAKHPAIISDGAWFQNLLELGVPLFVIYIFFYIICVRYAIILIRKNSNKFIKAIGKTFIIISIYFTYSNFINSSFLARSCYIMYWLIFGVLIGYKNHLDKQLKR